MVERWHDSARSKQRPATVAASNMPTRAEKSPSALRVREVFGGWVGWVAHRLAGYVRRIATATGDADPANIAVVCSAFLRYGSAQAIGLSQTGSNVTLYYVDKVNEFAGSYEDRALFLDRVRAAGVELVPVPRPRMRSMVRHTLWLHRDLRRRKIATAVVQWHIDPRYATLGLALPVALIVHDPQTHTGDTLSSFSAPVRLIARVSELTASCLMIHSARLLDQIRPLLRRLPIGVIPLGTDMAPAPAGIPRERRLLIFGRLFEYKGVDTALEAFGSLPQGLSDTELIVAGRGPLADLARNQRNVDVREGYIAESDIQLLLEGARLVLLPYKDATQSAVGLQALALGVPCVVSSAGGLPDLVPDSYPSLVVPPDDPERLAEAIAAHIDHHEDLRRASYDHAASHFAWPVAAQCLRSELQRLGLEGLTTA
jgi:glycosyltransferase involved in cell wall biosynthesis